MRISVATQQLLEACVSGDITVVKAAIAAGAEATIYEQSSKDASPAVLAAENNHLEILKYLVNESGQQLDLTAADNSPARWAAFHGHLEVLKWLVMESGQAVDVTASGNWAVYAASDNGHLETVKWLVHESGQAVELMTSAIEAAAANGHLDFIRWAAEESCQEVDFSAGHNCILRVATQHVRSEVVQYVLFESGQLDQILDETLDWLSFVDKSVLNAIFVTGFGAELSISFESQEDFFADLYAELEKRRQTASPSDPLTILLKQLNIPVDQRKPYYLSEPCRKAAVARLHLTHEDLDRMLHASQRRPASARSVTRL